MLTVGSDINGPEDICVQTPCNPSDFWPIFNVVSAGLRPHCGKIWIVSIDTYLILQRSTERFSPKPDLLFAAYQKDRTQLGLLAITPSTLAVLDESDRFDNNAWQSILTEAMMPVKIRFDGNDMIDVETGKKYGGLDLMISDYGEAFRFIVQCKGDNVNDFIKGDPYNKSDVGNLPFTLEEFVNKLTEAIRGNNE
ncbi:MAG: hypothetical protein LBK63_06870 [Treponema sp.]|jgi:hypothetical protein|nr:hypothetical protein [Treponema sp.]